MKVKSLISITVLSSMLLSSLLIGSVSSVAAQGSAPPLAPSRLLRSSSSGANSGSTANSGPTASQTSSFNGSVLNGSVINNSTASGASRLLRQDVYKRQPWGRLIAFSLAFMSSMLKLPSWNALKFVVAIFDTKSTFFLDSV